MGTLKCALLSDARRKCIYKCEIMALLSIDERLGLTALAGEYLTDIRTKGNNKKCCFYGQASNCAYDNTLL